MAQGETARRFTSDIPDKLYFRIGEVARLCEVPAYVLRFWESEFTPLRPNKGGTGQRLYRKRDVEMALRIKRLLYDEGYTIPGARQILKSESKQKEPQLTLTLASTLPPETRGRLEAMKTELNALASLLSVRVPQPSRPLPGTSRRAKTQSISKLEVAPPGGDRTLLFEAPGPGSTPPGEGIPPDLEPGSAPAAHSEEI